jgi:osmotically-inducible protein OsmY
MKVNKIYCSGAWTLALIAFLGVATVQNATPSSQSPADNTRINNRDKSRSEATADQQRENASDRALTQEIRKSLLRDKSLSAYAHNVKIITQDGNVVLKGPVRSVEEKKAVEAKAIAIAGEDRVSSQIQVAPK